MNRRLGFFPCKRSSDFLGDFSKLSRLLQHSEHSNSRNTARAGTNTFRNVAHCHATKRENRKWRKL
jgi:hypothetical protein